jgi:maltose alpha-D-glucosyltransferase/alpha-amylase
LVYVDEEDRKYIHDNYCKQPTWDFRLGQGVAARLSELLDRDPQKIGLAFSVMLSLPGTPIVYYGDEFGKLNDQAYYEEMIKLSGKDDTRFLVRGKINWDLVEGEFKNKSSLGSQVFHRVKSLLNARNKMLCFGRGEIEWIPVTNAEGEETKKVLCYIRSYGSERVLVVQNLSSNEFWSRSEVFKGLGFNDLLGNAVIQGKEPGYLLLKPRAYHWIKLS